MWIFLIALVILVMKMAEYGPVATWSWWWVMAPLAATALWWEFSDRFGLTRRHADRKMEARKASRRQRAVDHLAPGRRRDK